MSDRVNERRRAAQLARHYRDQENLTIAEIARRLGRAEATVKAYLNDPSEANKSRPWRSVHVDETVFPSNPTCKTGIPADPDDGRGYGGPGDMGQGLASSARQVGLGTPFASSAVFWRRRPTATWEPTGGCRGAAATSPARDARLQLWYGHTGRG